MPTDNVGYTPGTGATVAADDINDVLYQRVKIVVGSDGVNDGDISTTNPLPIVAPSGVNITGTANVNITNTSVPITPSTGAEFNVNAIGELIECLEALRMYHSSLSRSIGLATVDAVGRLRVNMETGTTLATVTTLGNQISIGGFAANDQIPSLMHMVADNLRRNITVT